MDYRKPAVFGENWSESRYSVLPYFSAEKAVIMQPGISRILDLGCANGWNMSRFGQYGRSTIGLDMVLERVKLAQAHGPALVASGLDVPLTSESCDVVYIQHVLHHIGDVERALREARRVLRPGGVLFLVETVEDNPIIHWGRRFYPSWMGDEVNAPFHFGSLQETVVEAGFQIAQAEQYSVLFWLWEIIPDQLPIAEKATPFFVLIEQFLVRFWQHYSAHCYIVAHKRP
jgi:SAM-dependent methyltransferase